MDLINAHFPNLTAQQKAHFERLPELYADWNLQINVVSRKDVENLMERHVLHSLAIAKAMEFHQGAKVLDVGTGGGFPGIPLAILFPEVSFHLVDSIGKKIRVVQGVVDALGLKNAKATHGRAEEVPGTFDYVVSRAVAPMETLVYWTSSKLKSGQAGTRPNGWLVLKGGDLTEELSAYPKAERMDISRWFNQPFFETKQVVYLPRK